VHEPARHARLGDRIGIIVNTTALWLGIGYAVACAIGLALLFLVVRSTRGDRPEADVGRLERSERVWLWFLLVGLFALFAVTILDVPWRADAKANRLEVRVVGRQFYWSFDPAGPYPAGRQIEFVLTSADVNHGFGVYGPDGAFVLQAQVVPDATVKVRHTFETAGRYTVRCLEFCGLAHHEMVDGFTVRRAAS
jgi:cytochrome c oxidase subunit 2